MIFISKQNFTLRDIQNSVLKNAYDIHSAKLLLEKAQQVTKETFSSYLPKFDISYQRKSTGIGQNNLSFNVNYLLFDSFARKFNTKSALSLEKSSHYSLLNIQRLLKLKNP